MTASQIIDFLKTHPGWVLQHCNGSTLDSHWWWLRKKNCKVIHVNGNSARAAANKLKVVASNRYDTSTWVL